MSVLSHLFLEIHKINAYFSAMKIKLVLTLFIILLFQIGISKTNYFQNKSSQSKLYALVDHSDSGTKMTLKQANKNAEASENKNKYLYPFYFSPLLILIIALAVKRRKQKEKKNLN